MTTLFSHAQAAISTRLRASTLAWIRGVVVSYETVRQRKPRR